MKIMKETWRLKLRNWKKIAKEEGLDDEPIFADEYLIDKNKLERYGNPDGTPSPKKIALEKPSTR